MKVRTIEARVHGRYVTREGPRERLLVGFHGYAETAEKNCGELLKLPGIDAWTVVAVQALHPFYAMKTGEIVASWMTSLDRELAIADNVDYVRGVVDSFDPPDALVFCGFSQGAAMAYRAAAAMPCAAVIALGGDVPPDVTGPLPEVFIGRGTRDDWYTDEKLEKDLKFLEGRVRGVTTCVFEGGHGWSDEFRLRAVEFLRSLTGQQVDQSAG